MIELKGITWDHARGYDPYGCDSRGISKETAGCPHYLAKAFAKGVRRFPNR